MYLYNMQEEEKGEEVNKIILVVILVLVFGCGYNKKEKSFQQREDYANKHGYFWLPCPICGEYFGGHEWSCEDRHYTSQDGRHWGMCNKCCNNKKGDKDKL